MTVAAEPTRVTRTPRRRQSALSAEQLDALLQLLKGTDTVELKLTVPDAEQRSAMKALDLDPLGAQIRQVVFFDTPALSLDQQGIALRARRIQGRPGDVIVKQRPVLPAELSPRLRKTPGFGVEVDAMPGGFVCSATMKAAADQAQVRDAILGRRPIRKLFTKEQRAFLAERVPDCDLDGLSVLGPINVLKLKFVHAEYARKLVAELWFYPDGSRILELSTKCLPAEAFNVAAETRVFLTRRGISLLGEQQTKTKTALRFFARQLQGST